MGFILSLDRIHPNIRYRRFPNSKIWHSNLLHALIALLFRGEKGTRHYFLSICSGTIWRTFTVNNWDQHYECLSLHLQVWPIRRTLKTFVFWHRPKNYSQETANWPSKPFHKFKQYPEETQQTDIFDFILIDQWINQRHASRKIGNLALLLYPLRITRGGLYPNTSAVIGLEVVNILDDSTVHYAIKLVEWIPPPGVNCPFNFNQASHNLRYQSFWIHLIYFESHELFPGKSGEMSHLSMC